MNLAIMQLRMELSKLKQKYSQSELRMKRLFLEIQTFANPYYTNVNSIKAEELKQSAEEMVEVKKELINLEKTISQIKNELGEG